jgi:hypothetical protein
MDKTKFSELFDTLIQSTTVSGSDDIVKSMYNIELSYDTVDNSVISKEVEKLKSIAKINKKRYADNKTEYRVWARILGILEDK